MFDFNTQYGRQRVPANPGSGDRVLYSAAYDDRGRLELVEAGVDSLYDSIQSHADSVDIHVMLKRFAAGETDVFSQRQGAYGDFTEVPRTYAEMMQTLIDAESYFESLPVDVRGKFGHNFSEFVHAIGTPDFAERLGLMPAAAEQQPVEREEEVHES